MMVSHTVYKHPLLFTQSIPTSFQVARQYEGGMMSSQVSHSWGEGLLQMWHKISQVSLHPVLQSLGNPVEAVTCYCHYQNKMENWVWRSQAQDLRQPAGSLIFSGGEEVSKGSSFLHQKF